MNTIIEKSNGTKVKVSDYAKNVIATNKALKRETRTLGGCLKLMANFQTEMGLNSSQIAIIKLLRDDHKAYQTFKKVCRKSKSGNYSPFFILQAIHKSMKVDKPTKKATTKKAETKKAPKKEAVLTPIAEKSVKELRLIAKKQGLKGYSKLKKDELLKLVTAKK